MVDVERWLSYKGTCHVILLAKLHDMYLYKIDNFFHINHFLKSVSKVALLHRFYCSWKQLLLLCLKFVNCTGNICTSKHQKILIKENGYTFREGGGGGGGGGNSVRMFLPRF